MPAEERGFLFKHFDKIICAVVALALVLSLLYSARPARREAVDDLTGKIDNLENLIRPQMQKAPPEEPPKNYLSELERYYTEVAVTEPSINPFVLPTVSEQPPVLVGPDKDYTIAFAQPLDAGSIKIQGGAEIVASLEHPVGNDYSKVKIHTGTREGLATISAVAGESRVLQPVKVDRRAGGVRAEPPLKLTAQPKREGVQLRFEANPTNQKSVVVTSYEIQRKKPRDVDGKYEQVASLPVKDFELSEEAKAAKKAEEAKKAAALAAATPSAPGFEEGGWEEGGWVSPLQRIMSMHGVGVPTAPTPAQREEKPKEEERAYTWLDKEVGPDEVYLYRVCTVTLYSYPPRSEFTEETKAVTPPLIDFRCKGGVAPNVRFEVAVYEDGGVRRATFVNSVGDEIGGVQEDKQTGIQRNFLTGCQLVDYHPMVKRILEKRFGNMIVKTPVDSSRVVFIDRRGNVQTRWQNESLTDDLWVEKPAAPKRGTTTAPSRGQPPEFYKSLQPY